MIIFIFNNIVYFSVFVELVGKSECCFFCFIEWLNVRFVGNVLENFKVIVGFVGIYL